jgi:hypothetical protein
LEELWWHVEVLHNVGSLQRRTIRVYKRKKAKFMHERKGCRLKERAGKKEKKERGEEWSP